MIAVLAHITPTDVVTVLGALLAGGILGWVLAMGAKKKAEKAEEK